MIPSSFKTGQPRWVKVPAILFMASEGVGTPRSAVGKLVRNWRELHAVCIRWQAVYLAVAATYVSRFRTGSMFWVQAVDHFSGRDAVKVAIGPEGKRVYFLGSLMRVRGAIEPYALWRLILKCQMGLIRLAPN